MGIGGRNLVPQDVQIRGAKPLVYETLRDIAIL
jgi:hypothetical protein